MAVSLSVNGKPVSVAAPEDTRLLWVLREELKLTGTKFGCGARSARVSREVCQNATMMAAYRPQARTWEPIPLNSATAYGCLRLPLCSIIPEFSARRA